ncbi:MAG TPA: hypothetical protein VIL49_02725 [Capillimicrobium sp.]|jgi:hypothetical protein
MRLRTPATIFTAAACALALAGPASADDVRVSESSVEGKRAAGAALERVGGGNVFRIRRDDDDRASKRYRVDIRKGRFVYEVDVSASFQVTEVERERARPGDDDGTDDQGSGDNR